MNIPKIPVHPITQQKIPLAPPADGGGWMRLPTFLSACDDAAYPFDREVTRALRAEFGHGSFVPLMRYTTYQSPGGAYFTWPHLVWARYVPLVEHPNPMRRLEHVMWPASPTATNYGCERYAHSLYVEDVFDGGLGGDSKRSPGRIYPLNWNHYRYIKSKFDRARHITREEEAREVMEASQQRREKARDEVRDMESYRLREDWYRHVGEPRVSVPTSYGEVA